MTQKTTQAKKFTALVLAASISAALLIYQTTSTAEPAQSVAQFNLAAGPSAKSNLEFRGTISGDVLDFSGLDEVETAAVKSFKQSGENPYHNDSGAIKKGGVMFATACAGCHGHLAEGKLGPALADDYWTYPKNETDKGMFETIYDGAAGMMGPQRGLITQDEMLHIISWLRWQQAEVAKGNSGAH